MFQPVNLVLSLWDWWIYSHAKQSVNTSGSPNHHFYCSLFLLLLLLHPSWNFEIIHRLIRWKHHFDFSHFWLFKNIKLWKEKWKWFWRSIKCQIQFKLSDSQLESANKNIHGSKQSFCLIFCSKVRTNMSKQTFFSDCVEISYKSERKQSWDETWTSRENPSGAWNTWKNH